MRNTPLDEKHPYLIALGERVRLLRSRRGLSRKAAAARAQVSERHWANLESGMGNASSHDATNLPILVAGGGFKHGRHIAHDPTSPPPLCNLWVQTLQHLGVETEKFGTSKGQAISGLDVA